MALQTRLSNVVALAACNAIVDLIDGGAAAGTVTIYGGTQPDNADDATVEPALATITLADPAFGPAADLAPGARATALGVPLATVGLAAGTATWFRVKDSDGLTILDGSAGLAAGTCDMTLDNVSIGVGQAVTITAWTITFPEK